MLVATSSSRPRECSTKGTTRLIKPMMLARALPALFVALVAHAAEAPSQQFSRFSGRVLNTLTGEPLRKAQITLRSRTAPDTSYRLATDEQGAFSLPAAPTGDYDAVVQRPGFVTASKP